MSKAGRITFIAVGLAALALVTRVEAQKVTREPIKPVDGVAGSVSYRAYCAQCHGTTARGDGPVAKALKVPPADLTQLAKRNGGTFPAPAVKAFIKGDNEIAAHGTREMPLWGPVLRSIDSEPITELRIANLVRYLESLQQK